MSNIEYGYTRLQGGHFSLGSYAYKYSEALEAIPSGTALVQRTVTDWEPAVAPFPTTAGSVISARSRAMQEAVLFAQDADGDWMELDGSSVCYGEDELTLVAVLFDGPE